VCKEDVNIMREKVYEVMEEYVRTTYPSEPGRFAKLLLRLPVLRSIGLKCQDPLFFYRCAANKALVNIFGVLICVINFLG